MTQGFTLNSVASRIRDLENKTNGAYYVALNWLAMSRNSGKGAKKALEAKIFGQEKPTSTFRNAWRIADKSFSEGFHAGHRSTVAELGLDDAVKFAVKALEDHKTALGVSNMGDYEAACKFASQADIPAEVEAEAADETAAKRQAVEFDPLNAAVEVMMSLSAPELVEFAAKVQARLMELDQTEQLPMAA